MERKALRQKNSIIKKEALKMNSRVWDYMCFLQTLFAFKFMPAAKYRT